MFRANKTFGEEKVIRKYHIVCDVSGNHYLANEFDEIIDKEVLSTCVAELIDPDTLEIYLFGEWRLVADLEEKFVLLDKEHSEKLHDMTYDFAMGKTDGEELVKYVHQKIKG